MNVPDENPTGLGAFEFPLGFEGQYRDKETSLHYNYHRDYDPGLGRYGESDPIGLGGGLNTYLYGHASPLLNVDPEGLQVAPPGGVVAIGGSSAAASGAIGGSTGIAAGIGSNAAIAKGLQNLWNNICNAVGRSRVDRCNDAFKNCIGWRLDPKWKNRCGEALQQCLNTELPVIFPNGD